MYFGSGLDSDVVDAAGGRSGNDANVLRDQGAVAANVAQHCTALHRFDYGRRAFKRRRGGPQTRNTERNDRDGEEADDAVDDDVCPPTASGRFRDGYVHLPKGHRDSQRRASSN